MPNIFSEDLIFRIKKYFKDRFGQNITTDEAVVFLSSLADLYLVVSASQGQENKESINHCYFYTKTPH
jgi:hypothetical protein